MNSRLWAWLALFLTVMIWGLSFPSIKVSLVELPPMTLAWLRFVVAGLAMALILRLKEGRVRPVRADLPALLWTVLSGITLYFLFENHGVNLISASGASLIIASIPVLSLLAEKLVYGRAVGGVGAAASLLSFVGVGLLVGLPPAGQAENPWGYVLMLGAGVSWVVYLIVSKPLQGRYSSLALTTWQMVGGALTLLPLALLEIPAWKWPSWFVWANVVFQGLVCSAAGYLLYNQAMKAVGIRASSAAVNVIPVVTAVAAFFWLDERLGPWQLAGGALVLLAVGWLSWTEGRRRS